MEGDIRPPCQIQTINLAREQVGMNLTDATLVLLLAARIHRTDEAVRASAKSVVKKLPRSKRGIIYKVIEAKSPLHLVGFLAENLDD